jgi:hypothetical protein
VKRAAMPTLPISHRLTPAFAALTVPRKFTGATCRANRWDVLAVLFAVRLGMAFQFESVAAVALLLGREFSVSLADIGVLIALDFGAAVLVACPLLLLAFNRAATPRPPSV